MSEPRADLILRPYDRQQRLIEIGPSYKPLAAKADGWNTVVVDHCSRDELIAKYGAMGQDTSRIEDVDYISDGKPLEELIQDRNFDGIVSSHNLEHLPDIVSFFTSAEQLLKPDGIIALALPDHRVCFDFFRPRSTTGQVLNAMGRQRHSRASLFDNHAYYTERGGTGGWLRNLDGNAEFAVLGSLPGAWNALQYETDHPSEYVDAHAWCFTPASFQLIMFELNVLGVIKWAVQKIELAAGVEFYVWLERRAISDSAIDVKAERERLLRETIMETREHVSHLLAPKKPQLRRKTIAAVIPLYNGARYIRDALKSIYDQTLPADEVIVVDDGSSDNGYEIVREMQPLHDNLVLLRKDNGGQSSARNYGVAHCKSELIAFLDQDDMWYPSHLEKLVRPFLRERGGAELGWVYSNLDEVNENGQLVARSYLSNLNASHPKRDVMPMLLGDMFILPSASIVARSAFEAVGGFDEQLSGYEDDDLFLRLFRAGYDNVYVETPLSRWRIHTESASYTKRMQVSRARYARKLLQDYPNDPKRRRFYVRDLIAPRFFLRAVSDYLESIDAGDRESAEEARKEIVFWLPMLGTRLRLLGKAILAVPRHRTIVKAARTTHHAIRPLLHRLA